MITDLEPVTSLDALVMKPGPDLGWYRPHIPTILIPKCLYFPSFDNEEDVDDESQDQSSVPNKIHTHIPNIASDILHCEEVDDESSLPAAAQNPHDFMQRIFVEMGYLYGHYALPWACVGLELQLPIYVGPVLLSPVQSGDTIHGSKGKQCTPLSGEQNKVFDPGICCVGRFFFPTPLFGKVGKDSNILGERV